MKICRILLIVDTQEFSTFEMLNQNQFNFLFSNHTPQAHKLNFSRKSPISGSFFSESQVALNDRGSLNISRKCSQSLRCIKNMTPQI